MAAQCSAPSARASAKRAQRRAKRAESLSGSMRQFVTPQVWKQVKHAAKQHGCRDRTRWTLQPLILIAAIMTWCAGETDADRFVLSRAFYVQVHAPKRQRPGKTFSGFCEAMLRLPMPVWWAFCDAVRSRIFHLLADRMTTEGWLPLGCDSYADGDVRAPRVGTELGEVQPIHISLVPESGWPHPIPNLPLLSWSVDRVGGLCLRLKLVSEDLEHTQVISHDNHALGMAHAFAHVTTETDLANRAPARSVCTAAAVASLRARFSHSCGINVSLASLGLCARTCERYQGLFSPGSRPTASSQTLSASPTGLRARWACGLMVLGTTKCLHETWDGRFSSASRSPGRSEERNGRQGGSACRWPQVFHTQAIRLRPM